MQARFRVTHYRKLKIWPCLFEFLFALDKCTVVPFLKPPIHAQAKPSCKQVVAALTASGALSEDLGSSVCVTMSLVQVLFLIRQYSKDVGTVDKYAEVDQWVDKAIIFEDNAIIFEE